jgi:putative transposase
MLIRIPPKYPVSQIVGFLKGKSAIMVAREFLGKARNFSGKYFWARGYIVSTVGADERIIRDYIRHQEGEDIKEDQQRLFH